MTISNPTPLQSGHGYVGRFAPSPTGPLHLGSLLAALASRLDALAHGGRWRLRIDDGDVTRAEPDSADSIAQTLTRFGFCWDGPITRQSERDHDYARAFDALRERNAVFSCSCSRRELEQDAIRGVDGAPVYDGRCRNGPVSRNRALSWRLRVGEEKVTYTDRALGIQEQDLSRDVGDFVIRRADGIWAYQLAVVVDDALDGVTDVVRGADLATSTARQIFLQSQLGLPRPRYLHVPVVTNARGEKLSKQSGAPALDPKCALSLLEDAALRLDLGPVGAQSVERFWSLAPALWRASRWCNPSEPPAHP